MGANLMERVSSPEALRALPVDALPTLAEQLRQVLIQQVCRSGGHLGPNLGMVEITIALHRVFDSPWDTLLFDTGHQAYVHKLLTGRYDGFASLRTRGGLSGYPDRRESVHDHIGNSHASTALSYAEGIAKGYRITGVDQRWVVAVVGDGSLTGGMAWEALNNLGASPDLPVVIVLNDNGRSYAPTVGGLGVHLQNLRNSDQHPPQADLFTRLGLSYLGPVDGHDTVAVEDALIRACRSGRTTVVHCVTRKGNGYRPAMEHEADQMHAIGPIDPATGKSSVPGETTWTKVFGEELCELGAERPDLVCLSAAMLLPAGLGPFAQRYPDRVFDVGIAEQHALTSAAGLAMAGLHPLVAVYSTFLNRAFDQLLMDVALHDLPVTVILDRAGITGPDGPSHHGMWDLPLLCLVPGLRAAAPRDPHQLRQLLREAVGHHSGPTALRFPKASAGDPVPALEQVGQMDILYRSGPTDVLLVAIGTCAPVCIEAAGIVARQGVGVTVVDPRWFSPVPQMLPDLAAAHRGVVTVEEGVETGGAGAAITHALSAAQVRVPVRMVGLPDTFIEHGAREELLAAAGLTAEHIAECALETL
ncbi:1-deoxy-D-xylulose-5-phosphate synthase [Streptomyces sp. N35]|uniref:1-deoxy-D-xylulose-5-phosphate synthase n=1 Tax=Streptomyces sp. N35 TaxID=2795730 RepID=UPI0018F4A4DC|nr:1-deoxy-D-xylulose-5-phosphate synthase [Streptomyces sp. N35]